MALPSVHRCLQLSDENEQLLKKLKKLRVKNRELEKNLAQFQGKLHVQQSMHSSVPGRDVQVQTESHLWLKDKDLNLERESARLLQMYNDLQKRYIKEIKTNQEQSETIKNLTGSSSFQESTSNQTKTDKEKAKVFFQEARSAGWLCREDAFLDKFSCNSAIESAGFAFRIKIHELEHNLREQRQRTEQLECKKVSKKARAVSEKRSQTPEGEVTSCRHLYKKEELCCSKYLELLLKEIKKLKKENEKLSAERRALRNELAGLDKEFFDEIEDLKNAVQVSVKLNNEYEKCLKQISAIYGLPLTPPL